MIQTIAVILVLAFMAGAAGILVAVAAGVLPRRPKENVIAVEGPDGEIVTYTREEAWESIDKWRERREKLLEVLEKAPARTPAQQKRWRRSYNEAVALTAAANSLEEALAPW